MNRKLLSALTGTLFILLSLTGCLASTFTTRLTFSAGSGNTGHASTVLVTIKDNSGNVLVAASNSPSGTAFAESTVVPGSYYAPYTIDTSKLPITTEFVISGTSVGAMAVIGNDRAAQVADGYTTAAAAKIAGLPSTFPTNFASMAISGGGAVTVGTNGDKTGYSLTQAFPTNFSSLAIDGTGKVQLTASEHSLIANTDVWGTALPGAFGAGTAGLLLGNAGSIMLMGGKVNLNLAQPLDLTQLGVNTVGAAHLAAIAQGVGKWTIIGNTLTIYDALGTTIVRTFTISPTPTASSRQ